VRACNVEGCVRRHYARGYCRTHYIRNRLYGSPLGQSDRSPVRFEFAPLERQLRLRCARISNAGKRPVGFQAPAAAIGEADRDLSDRDLAAVLGVHRGTVGAWRRKGLTRWTADTAAVTAGLHPIELWPHWAAPTEGRDEWANSTASP
jgi:hypothetical protein